MKYLKLRGAREHNLKNIDIDIPKNTLTVITGVSGSGKSTLALDTIYAEGQRRYVESLSVYARQFLGNIHKPDVDTIEGLSPAISIEQKTTSNNPRSTVGTITEIYDYLRLLFARVGIAYSPATGLPISKMTVPQMVESIKSLPQNTKLNLLAPVVRNKKGEFKQELTNLVKQGFERFLINGQVYLSSELPTLSKTHRQNISLVVSRLVVSENLSTSLLSNSFETALAIGKGVAVAQILKDDLKTPEKEITFSENLSCPVSGFAIEELEPSLFSFNSPNGACPNCSGLGFTSYFDVNLVVPNKALPLKDAFAPFNIESNNVLGSYIKSICKAYNVNLLTPYERVDPSIINKILYGTGEEKLTFEIVTKSFLHKVTKPFKGVIRILEDRMKESTSHSMIEYYTKFKTEQCCKVCNGMRLGEKALQVKIIGSNIGEVTKLSLSECLNWVSGLPKKLTKKQTAIASSVIKELQERLTFLNHVGLDYLTLERTAGTLSGGEAQRIRLASQIGSGLTGVLYVLDEPSIGLHQKDNDNLIQTMLKLRDMDNTLIVVEHDEDTIRAADHLIDVGPLAGEHGGKIVAQGTPEEVMKVTDSLTGQYLTKKRAIEVPTQRRRGREINLELNGACGNNLKNIDVKFPLGTFIGVSGVSGSGKSTLINETLYKAVAKIVNKTQTTPLPYKSIKNLEYIDKVIDIDQSPIGKMPTSNPATYTGVFDKIRALFAEQPLAKALGYDMGRFSFNKKGGRCEHCEGKGFLKIEMHFLPDVIVNCDECGGKRYNLETLKVTFKGKNISEVLDMTVEEATGFFTNIPAINQKVVALNEVGLGYMRLGQPAPTLSGGEAQRVKLATELAKRSTGNTLYILDEPTTGLHFYDIQKLLEVLHALVDKKNTVVVIEHNLDVLKTADYIIDIGKDGGHRGGTLIAFGTPEEVAECKESYTAKYLKRALSS